VAALSAIAVAGFALAIYAAWLFHDMPDASQLADYRPPTATRVYAWDGTLIGEFSRERRIFVPYDQIPPMLINAFLAAEDRNFFQHGGVDPAGMMRAMGKDVAGQECCQRRSFPAAFCAVRDEIPKHGDALCRRGRHGRRGMQRKRRHDTRRSLRQQLLLCLPVRRGRQAHCVDRVHGHSPR